MSEKSRLRYFPPPESYQDMLHYAEQYEKKKLFPPGSFVYLDLVRKAFHKGTSTQKRGTVYIVESVVKYKQIRRWRLMDLNFQKLPGTYYLQVKSA